MAREIVTKRPVRHGVDNVVANGLQTVQESCNPVGRVKVPPPLRLIRRVE